MRLTLLLVLVLSGCTRDWVVPPERTPDGGAGPECTTKADCEYGLCQNEQCIPTICEVPGDCASGFCESGNCTTPDCVVDDDCLFGLCFDNTCDTTKCVVDDDCLYGLCRTGECNELICVDDSDCRFNACFGGACSGCRTDDDCFGALVCNNGGQANELGLCTNPELAGPPLTGNPAAMTMLDSLQTAWTWVTVEIGQADLVAVRSFGVEADGTIDVTGTATASQWLYVFRLAAGRDVSVQYISGAGPSAGYYYDSETGFTSRDSVPLGVWQTFQDSPDLVTAMTAQPNCGAPQGTALDQLSVEQVTGGSLEFSLQTAAIETAVGDPVTGAVNSTTCQ